MCQLIIKLSPNTLSIFASFRWPLWYKSSCSRAAPSSPTAAATWKASYRDVKNLDLGCVTVHPVFILFRQHIIHLIDIPFAVPRQEHASPQGEAERGKLWEGPLHHLGELSQESIGHHTCQHWGGFVFLAGKYKSMKARELYIPDLFSGILFQYIS